MVPQPIHRSPILCLSFADQPADSSPVFGPAGVHAVITDGIIGLTIADLGFGYLGLILGVTFLGGFDIHELTGFEGYELTTYLGIVAGGIFGIFMGIKLAMRSAEPPADR